MEPQGRPLCTPGIDIPYLMSILLRRGVVFGGSQPVAANGQRPGPEAGRARSSIVAPVAHAHDLGPPGPVKGLADDGLEPSAPPRRQIHEPLSRMRGRGQPMWITGHSLGGALAVLQAACLQFRRTSMSKVSTPAASPVPMGSPRRSPAGSLSQGETL